MSSSLAGSDTIAIAVRGIFYYLVKSPRVYNKLVDEITKADSEGLLSNLVTFQESQDLVYLYVGGHPSLTQAD